MILIIDDDGAIRTSLTFKLNRIGYDAQAVATPKEAMAVVRSVAPELILMDMNSAYPLWRYLISVCCWESADCQYIYPDLIFSHLQELQLTPKKTTKNLEHTINMASRFAARYFYFKILITYTPNELCRLNGGTA